MSKVFNATAVSVDGFVTGRDPRPGHGLGDGSVLFDWYGGDDPVNKEYFERLSGRVGAIVVGRNTFDDSEGFGGGSPHPTAPMILLTHRPAEVSERQTLITTGIEDAVAAARELAGDKDVALMGAGALTSGLRAGLVDEFVLHQVPVLLGSGRPYFQELPDHIGLELVETIPTPAVTHLHYRVASR